MTFAHDLVVGHRESYAVEFSAEARAGASLRVRAATSTRQDYGLSRK
jgi:hypothetical protein